MKPQSETILIDCFEPREIERRSFEIIESELQGRIPFAGQAWAIARRMIHTVADYSLLDSLVIPERAIQAGITALKNHAPIFTDTEMARAGMPRRRLDPLGVEVFCFTSAPKTAQYAKDRGITAARAGIELTGPRLGGAILAVGNAPTAILALLDYLDNPANIPPALIIAMPVGFVNAAQAKELLLRRPGLACIAVKGRRGGSPLAAATVNALAELALVPCTT
jgi:precorrin-8X/cobalt-precorrin-8 methylmutase